MIDKSTGNMMEHSKGGGAGGTKHHSKGGGALGRGGQNNNKQTAEGKTLKNYNFFSHTWRQYNSEIINRKIRMN